MTRAALRLTPWLCALARASVSDTVLGGVARPGSVQQPPVEGQAAAEEPPTGGDGRSAGASFVICRGQQLCSGEETSADGLLMCAGGLYCKDWALVVSPVAGAVPQEVAGDVKAAVAEGAEPSHSGKETEETFVAGQAESISAIPAGALESAERLYYCPGGYGCSHWGWRYGRPYCDGGYRCMGWGNGWHGGNGPWHGDHDDHHGGPGDWHGGGGSQPGNPGQGGWNGGGSQPGNGGQGGWNGGGSQGGNGGQGGSNGGGGNQPGNPTRPPWNGGGSQGGNGGQGGWNGGGSHGGSGGHGAGGGH